MTHEADELARIADPGFRARYGDVPDIVESWVKDRLDLGTADVLDFGCGEGVAALGMVRRKRVRALLGVDIMPDPARCLPVAREQLGIEALPENLELQQIGSGADFAPGRRFDLIYSWSVFEHVEQRKVLPVLEQLRDKLRPGGYLFVQIAPLYYSADGSHLFHRIPEPWGHLRNQDSDYFRKLCEACDSREEVDALWSCYQWLNRMTVPELRRKLVEAGFEVEREYTCGAPHEVPADLLEVYQREALETNQVVFLARATAAAPGRKGLLGRLFG